ncbi:MAG: hypothetical protein KAS73_03880 [Candidatus Sabulitectum sp.]|nr:hypothetical protein [Candidatus Sabulitectum sp.]
MLRILLLAGAVGFPFSLNSEINDSWVADGWRIKEVARISLEDYIEPANISNVYTNGCFVEVFQDPDCSWRVQSGDGHRVVSIKDGCSPRILNIQDEWYSLIHSASDQYVLLLSRLNDLPAVFRYNLETGEGYPVVSDRDNLRMGSFGQFRSQMNRNGDVYYIDLNGYIGSYSDSDGLTEQRITDSEYPIAVFDQALSSDGDLFSASVVRGADAEQVILGYNIENGLLWETDLRSGGELEASSDGSFIAVDRASCGISLLDGRTGRELYLFLEDRRICTLAISPTGRFVASSFFVSDRPGRDRATLFSSIDTQSTGSATIIFSGEDDGFRGTGFVRAVTDDGTFLVESFSSTPDNEMQYFLYDQTGSLLWKSPICYSTNGLWVSLLMENIGLCSVTHINSGYLIGYCIPDRAEIVIVRIEGE